MAATGTAGASRLKTIVLAVQAREDLLHALEDAYNYSRRCLLDAPFLDPSALSSEYGVQVLFRRMLGRQEGFLTVLKSLMQVTSEQSAAPVSSSISQATSPPAAELPVQPSKVEAELKMEPMRSRHPPEIVMLDEDEDCVGEKEVKVENALVISDPIQAEEMNPLTSAIPSASSGNSTICPPSAAFRTEEVPVPPGFCADGSNVEITCHDSELGSTTLRSSLRLGRVCLMRSFIPYSSFQYFRKNGLEFSMQQRAAKRASDSEARTSQKSSTKSRKTSPQTKALATTRKGSRVDEDKEEEEEAESGSDGTPRRSQSKLKRRGWNKSPGSKHQRDHIAELDEPACAKEYIDELLVDDDLPMPVKPSVDWLPDASLYGESTVVYKKRPKEVFIPPPIEDLKELPLGGRFKYMVNNKTYVIIKLHGTMGIEEEAFGCVQEAVTDCYTLWDEMKKKKTTNKRKLYTPLSTEIINSLIPPAIHHGVWKPFIHRKVKFLDKFWDTVED